MPAIICNYCNYITYITYIIIKILISSNQFCYRRPRSRRCNLAILCICAIHTQYFQLHLGVSLALNWQILINQICRYNSFFALIRCRYFINMDSGKRFFFHFCDTHQLSLWMSEKKKDIYEIDYSIKRLTILKISSFWFKRV